MINREATQQRTMPMPKYKKVFVNTLHLTKKCQSYYLSIYLSLFVEYDGTDDVYDALLDGGGEVQRGTGRHALRRNQIILGNINNK